ncbi:MAG: class I SAM-dependent rRNA methyltransferase [Oculatellaceae cyanobacterium Prado106]|jgi:23S rRNA (cytosine1962-C5)-methyltransferase|nr:class I SAM-dependent rRNA methyltransferase [Oculatellaceae cyanobacterium Prado106]
MPKLTDISLPTSLKQRLAQGHPWVYRNHVPPQIKLRSGTWVKVRCGGWTGYGLWDTTSSIAIRIFSERQLPQAQWLRSQVQAAWELRSPLRQKGCTAYRWLFGEGDGLPGLTVDLYGDFAVIQTYMESAAVLMDDLVNALKAIHPLKGILLRTQHGDDADRDSDTGGKGKLLWGELPPPELVVQEHHLKFQVDLQTGQKTGLFLDHRENRRFLEDWSQGKQVLNCFAYTGAFSLYALRGGASRVVSVDVGRSLPQSASQNIALNNLDESRHQFITEDCFDLLGRYAEQKQKFDLIILDPPSFAKTKQNRFAAIRAYTKINALACKCVAPGGLLATASCTSQVSPEAFKEMIAAAASSSGDRFQIIHEAGQPLDHPVPAQFPEGRYLKFVVGRVEPVQ